METHAASSWTASSETAPTLGLEEIEERRDETRRRCERARLEAETAHTREMASLIGKRRRGPSATTMIALAIAGAAVALIVALVFVFSVVPKRQAQEEAVRARALIETHDPSALHRAEEEIAVARLKDPENPEIAALADLALAQDEASEQKSTDEIAARRQAIADLRRKLETPASTTQPTAAMKPATPKKPSSVKMMVAKKPDNGCDVEVSGVPMCGKAL